MLSESIAKLVQYGITTGLTPECERNYTTNLLLDVFHEDDYEKPDSIEEPVNLEELVGDIRLSDLNRIFQSIMKRQEEKIDKVRSKFGKIEKEEVSLEEKMEYLTDYAASHKHFSFRGLLTASSSKVEVIVTFLAILELMKTGKLTIVQEHIFDDIRIESRIAA